MIIVTRMLQTPTVLVSLITVADHQTECAIFRTSDAICRTVIEWRRGNALLIRAYVVGPSQYGTLAVIRIVSAIVQRL